MAQVFNACAALPEDRVQFPALHQVTHSYSQLQLQGHPTLASVSIYTQVHTLSTDPYI